MVGKGVAVALVLIAVTSSLAFDGFAKAARVWRTLRIVAPFGPRGLGPSSRNGSGGSIGGLFHL